MTNQIELRKREHLATMRAHAMAFRIYTSPDIYAPWQTFSWRINHAATFLRLAMDYRDMAREVVAP